LALQGTAFFNNLFARESLPTYSGDESMLERQSAPGANLAGGRVMRTRSLHITAAASLSLAALLLWPALGTAQRRSAPAPTTPGDTAWAECNPLSDLVPEDPNTPAEAKKPAIATPVTKNKILRRVTKDTLLSDGGARLPCQEITHGSGPDSKTTLVQNLQRGFDFYSWLTFIALNSPSNGSRIDAQSDAKTKWEDGSSFKQLLDVMIPNPDTNKPEWKTPLIPKGCEAQHKANPKLMVISMIEETFNQPFKTGPLIDQQGSYALFDILMNKQMFDYIVDNHLYNKTVQMSAKMATFKVDFPAGRNPKKSENGNQAQTGDPGAIMLKVSWKILDTPEERKRFHAVDALVSMPAAHDQKHDSNARTPCLRKTLGLVGFHVGHKTASRLQWIWTSFEHVDNVPEQQEVHSGNLKQRYSFYDPSCPPNKCPVNATPPRPWDPTHDKGLKFHSGFTSQITRTVPLTDDTKKMNADFQRILRGTVWENYMLLTTQWPSTQGCADKVDPPKTPNTDLKKEPDMNCGPVPTFMANSTLETYSQGEVPQASSSCMGCHGNAVSYQQRPKNVEPKEFFNQSDFTFMLEKAQGPLRRPPGEASGRK
jgi:hypothetical protein